MEGKQIKPDETVPIDASQVAAIEIERIVPSSFETQTRRRARFKAEEIASLGASFQKHGVRQPILVRPVYPNFEIVFGERRFLAAKSINLPEINCFIDDLTDEEVLELQYEENHRRQENSPLDDAFLFNFLMEKYGYSEEQLADRLGTSRRNVVEKLKLNDLIAEAVTELESNSLPLKHAYYLAKFPAATQREIVREKYAYKYNDNSEKAVSFDEFRAEVEENILRRLANAPFNIGDPRLHIKQIICVNCPEQTGAQNYLFPDHAGTDARCLNPGCFRLKTDTHLKLQREAIAFAKPNTAHAPREEVVKSVPLVTSTSYAPERSPFGKEKVLTNVQPLPEPECEFSESSLAVGGERKGEQVYICRENSCEIHNPQPAGNDAQTEKTAQELERKVRAAVREKILAAALATFDDYHPVWLFDDLIQQLLLRLWHSCGYDTRKPILWIVRKWKPLPREGAEDEIKSYLASLDKTEQSKLIFLFVHATTGFYSNSSDEEIKKLAADYTKLDYDQLTAEIRETMT